MRAEELRKRRAKFAKRNTKENYLLAKLIHCGRCGEGMAGYTVLDSLKNDGRSYYRCKSRVYSKSCSMPYIRTDRIDPLVWDEIKKVVKNPSLIRQAVEQKNVEYERVLEDFRRELYNIDNKVERLQNQKQRVIRAYRRGKLDLDELGDQKQEIQEEENRLDQEGEEIKLLLGSERNTRQNLLQLEEFAGKIQDSIDNLDFEQRRNIIELLVKKVLITSEGRLRVECIVPSGVSVATDAIAEVSSQREASRTDKISRFVEPAFCSSWSPALLIPPGVLPIRTRKTLSSSTVPPWPKSTKQNLTDYGRIGISKALWWTN
ncbi:MAG: recombinase zinc beta ribbon domain-containing protein [Candidatus Aerophobus sp.]|nr:MAG: recombinase zinc beta ribbon domain-containing protein [Candidatus Aerophobus sp.]